MGLLPRGSYAISWMPPKEASDSMSAIRQLRK